MNAALFWRILIALVCVLAIFALLGPVSRVLGFPLAGDALTIVRVCVAAIAALYVFTGQPR
jgi:hypothetical protein